jgi:NTP pyrophosphatase (non-canonical NTP hydrolase)
MIDLNNIYRNARDFHKRFKNWPPPKEGAIEALHEEFNEFVDALESGNHHHAGEELIDLLWVMLGTFVAYFPGINHLECLRARYEEVNRKNALKTTMSHTRMDNGHIVRNSKLKGDE